MEYITAVQYRRNSTSRDENVEKEEERRQIFFPIHVPDTHFLTNIFTVKIEIQMKIKYRSTVILVLNHKCVKFICRFSRSWPIVDCNILGDFWKIFFYQMSSLFYLLSFSDSGILSYYAFLNRFSLYFENCRFLKSCLWHIDEKYF